MHGIRYYSRSVYKANMYRRLAAKACFRRKITRPCLLFYSKEIVTTGQTNPSMVLRTVELPIVLLKPRDE